MIIKNKVDKVIDILTYDLEDRTAIERLIDNIFRIRFLNRSASIT
jgi:hypothetical protein